MILPHTGNAQASADTALENALLWKITGNGLDTPSYMYGTFHAFCKNQIVLTPNITKSILSCKSVYLEIEISAQDTSTFSMEKAIGYGTVKDIIGKNNFETAVRIVNSNLKISADTLNKIGLGYLNKLTTESYLNCSLSSYDIEIAKFAINNNKVMKGLEDYDEHAISMLRITYGTGERLTNWYWDNLESQLKYLERNIELYQQQNITYLYLRSVFNADGTPKGSQQVLLDERNITWLPSMLKAMKKNPCFFAFGCAHLVGAKGMIGLLRAKGYTVTPIL